MITGAGRRRPIRPDYYDAVRRWLGDDSDRFTDDDITAVIDRCPGPIAWWDVAEELLDGTLRPLRSVVEAPPPFAGDD